MLQITTQTENVLKYDIVSHNEYLYKPEVENAINCAQC